MLRITIKPGLAGTGIQAKDGTHMEQGKTYTLPDEPWVHDLIITGRATEEKEKKKRDV